MMKPTTVDQAPANTWAQTMSAMGSSRADGMLGPMATAGEAGGGAVAAKSGMLPMSFDSVEPPDSAIAARADGADIWEHTIIANDNSGSALNYTLLFHVTGGELGSHRVSARLLQ